MTHHQQLLAKVLQHQLEGLTTSQVVNRLLSKGLADIRACERIAIYEDILNQEAEGTARCQAMRNTAKKFCCSYEKARDTFYYHIKHQ